MAIAISFSHNSLTFGSNAELRPNVYRVLTSCLFYTIEKKAVISLFSIEFFPQDTLANAILLIELFVSGVFSTLFT